MVYFKKFILATICSGLGMWITAGLWHNLILPNVNKNIHPHHEGLGLMLIAYFILAAITAIIYSWINKERKSIIINGIILGILIGIVWVFPHGLAMAAAHGTSILYEIKNTLWHMFEQGIGGLLIALIYGKNANKLNA